MGFLNRSLLGFVKVLYRPRRVDSASSSCSLALMFLYERPARRNSTNRLSLASYWSDGSLAYKVLTLEQDAMGALFDPIIAGLRVRRGPLLVVDLSPDVGWADDGEGNSGDEYFAYMSGVIGSASGEVDDPTVRFGEDSWRIGIPTAAESSSSSVSS